MGNKKIKFNLNTDMQIHREIDDRISMHNFIELHEAFIADKELEGLAERTLDDYTINLNYFRNYVEENIQSDLNRVAVDVNIFKNYIYFMLQEKEYSPFTINIRLRTLKCYLRWLHQNNYINENINIKLKLVKTPQDTIKPLTDVEVKKLLNACDLSTYAGFRDFSAMLLILDCGIRVGEMVQLKINDVDLKQGLINVRAEVSKTRVSRQLPISPKTCKLLKELVNCAIENKSDFLFQSTYGGQIKKQNLILSFRRLGEKVGLKKRCTPYIFRHTFATNAVKAGIMELFTLQRIMGHSSLATTRKYIQLETEDLKKKHRKASPIDRFFDGGNK
ncbi:tyrosine-type recombinase/integrase [Clostridium sp. UBA6640]|uniref:tyrosine-type recombinase/integrase n=1 Tax=Clostridium sp. UBA6640 TaxID=1946370 RepID=UPI0025C19545|nr:tyrosine-type recombinase/integrase [Clostridium sp. UBA6640]